MIIAPPVLARIAGVIALAVVLQAAFFSKITIFTVPPDVLPAVVVAFGLLGGAVVGASVGFAIGMLNDSLLLQTLGVSSLALITAGYFAGRWREGFDVTSAFVPPVVTAVLTALAASAFGAIQLMLGVDTGVSPLVVRDVLVQGLYGFGIGAVVYPLIRRSFRHALIDEAPLRVRRSERLGSDVAVGRSR